LKPCPECENLAQELYAALRSGDGAGVSKLICVDDQVLVAGTDPTEWWEGFGIIDRALRISVSDMAGYDLTGASPKAFTEGAVAWVSDSPRFQLPDGAVIPLRVTGVARNDGGAWRFLQLHMSLGVRSDLPPEVVAVVSRPRVPDSA
jgi:hypothetical protein